MTSEALAIGVLGGVRTPNLGEGEAVGGRGWYVRKSEGEFLYRPT